MRPIQQKISMHLGALSQTIRKLKDPVKIQRAQYTEFKKCIRFLAKQMDDINKHLGREFSL